VQLSVPQAEVSEKHVQKRLLLSGDDIVDAIPEKAPERIVKIVETVVVPVDDAKIIVGKLVDMDGKPEGKLEIVYESDDKYEQEMGRRSGCPNLPRPAASAASPGRIIVPASGRHSIGRFQASAGRHGGGGMTQPSLHDIADRLARLAPCHRDPFRFHEEKSELVADLRRPAANDNQHVGLGVSHHTVASIKKEMVSTGRIGQLEKQGRHELSPNR